MNVGTVLFSSRDNKKECWDSDSLTLLTSRMILENLLPFKECLVIQDNSFVTDLVDYYRLLLDVIRKNAHGKIKRITLLALTDVLGGYLQRFVLPRARDSYYAGYLSYSSMERLYKLFGELKDFLKTNGHGWARSSRVKHATMNVQSLSMRVNTEIDPCSLLIVTQKKEEPCSIEIPLPLTDSRRDPVAIAVPFKSQPFVGIESKAASNILVKYYITSIACLEKRNANKTQIGGFNGAFLDWINGYVMPILHKDKFYSAFGGVLRIIKTAEVTGMQVFQSKISNYNVMPETQETDVEKFEGDELSYTKRNNLILTSLLCTIFLWFLLGSLFICYRFTAGRRKGSDEDARSFNRSSKNRSSTVSPLRSKQSFVEPNDSNLDADSKKSTVVYYMENRNTSNANRIILNSLSKVPATNRNYIPSVSSKTKTLDTKIEIESSVGLQTSFADTSITTSSSEQASQDQERIVIEYSITSSSSESEER